MENGLQLLNSGEKFFFDLEEVLDGLGVLVDRHFQVSFLDVEIIFLLDDGRLELFFQFESLSLEILLLYSVILLFFLDLYETALDFFVLFLHRFQFFLQRRDFRLVPFHLITEFFFSQLQSFP